MPMRKDIPKEFLKEYKARHDYLEKALNKIISLLELRLGQLAARTGVRGRITDKRVKRPAKLWKNARNAGLSVEETFTRVEDILGIRIVCNNLSDIVPLVEMIRTDCGPNLTILDIKDKVSSPSIVGYRATHIRTELRDLYANYKLPIPCEIQIRTLAQDTWARLSRADLYGRNVPPSIQRLSQALSTQLSAIDEIGQLIRDELNSCPSVAEDILDSDAISPPKLALLYKSKFGEEIYEWSLIDWVRYLDEAEVEKIGEVRMLLDDTNTRKTLDKLSTRIRGFPLENLEWAVYSTLVATEAAKSLGIKAVHKRIQEGWDEIVTFARQEALAGMPETIDEFVEMLESGVVDIEALAELGGIQDCCYCGTDILSPEKAAIAVLEHYDNPVINVDLEALFWGLDGVDIPEVESVNSSGVCAHCFHMMSKDD